MSSEFFIFHQIFVNTLCEIPILATIKSLSDDITPWVACYHGHSFEARDMDLLLLTRVMTMGEGLSSTKGKVKSSGLCLSTERGLVGVWRGEWGFRESSSRSGFQMIRLARFGGGKWTMGDSAMLRYCTTRCPLQMVCSFVMVSTSCSDSLGTGLSLQQSPPPFWLLVMAALRGSDLLFTVDTVLVTLALLILRVWASEALAGM